MMSWTHNANHINKAYSRCCLMCVITSPTHRGSVLYDPSLSFTAPTIFLLAFFQKKKNSGEKIFDCQWQWTLIFFIGVDSFALFEGALLTANKGWRTEVGEEGKAKSDDIKSNGEEWTGRKHGKQHPNDSRENGFSLLLRWKWRAWCEKSIAKVLFTRGSDEKQRIKDNISLDISGVIFPQLTVIDDDRQ